MNENFSKIYLQRRRKQKCNTPAKANEQYTQLQPHAVINLTNQMSASTRGQKCMTSQVYMQVTVLKEMSTAPVKQNKMHKEDKTSPHKHTIPKYPSATCAYQPSHRHTKTTHDDTGGALSLHLTLRDVDKA